MLGAPLRVNRRGWREDRPLGFVNLCAFLLVHEQPPVHHSLHAATRFAETRRVDAWPPLPARSPVVQCPPTTCVSLRKSEYATVLLASTVRRQRIPHSTSDGVWKLLCRGLWQPFEWVGPLHWEIRSQVQNEECCDTVADCRRYRP